MPDYASTRQRWRAIDTFDGDGQLLRLGLQAYTLGLAYEFDPSFGHSICRVDPLPHQLTVSLTPNERRTAEDRRDCYWLYVVTHCHTQPTLYAPIKDPARLPWHEVRKVDHYYLSVDAISHPIRLREDSVPYNPAP
ncbi:MAG: DUF3883 domain-containing protein [Chloroflexi bacterium]|nr:DUF3883 domain-containing protein [Chloroflexota bacterium]